MPILAYLNIVKQRFASGISREHAYRGDLETLIRQLAPGVDVTNEPANVTDCGNPDYVITRSKIPIGYIEAKDVGKDLDSPQYREQFQRYRKALDNLIITNYLHFQFFQNGQLVREIELARIENNRIQPLSQNFAEFQDWLFDFCDFRGQTIKASKQLAEMMASKARLLQHILEAAVSSDEEREEDSSIKGQYESFKKILIHDLTPREFADIYAQTLAYGMFAARLNDTNLDTFSRQEAAELIPASNPFLRKLFQYVAGYDIDERIRATVDNLADVFRAVDLAALLQNFGQATQTEDPMIHFYETFLAEYDPKLRKARGVWYTPEPVVNFIVRSVDYILKTHFQLPQGLADAGKTKIKVKEPGNGKPVEREVHRVQILDPATGTGTFLASVVNHIYLNQFAAMQGAWSGYVENHLIPRLNGFELLMASYAMAHLKLDHLLRETGYKPQKQQRFHVYLTNSLEEVQPYTGTLFAQWLSREANEANQIKRDAPVMVVLGNPPYSGISSNNGKWISDLIDDYKYVDGEHFNERKHWLNDDYVKFIRYGQHFIEKTGEGILAFINPHGFLDNPTFRGMRWNLLKTFDAIYTIDLHGNAKKKETCPNGSKDENVFDIMQGVSINLFVKTGRPSKKQFAQVFHYDLYGTRAEKYEFLNNHSLDSVEWNQLEPKAPMYFMVQKDFAAEEEYKEGFSVVELFPKNNVGFVSANDGLNISMTKEEQKKKIENILTMQEDTWRKKYNRPKDAQSWKYKWAKQDANDHHDKQLTQVSYRPFDYRWSLYTGKSGGLYARPCYDVMRHFLQGENVGLVFRRQSPSTKDIYIFITEKMIADGLIRSDNKGGESTAPLYLYPDTEADGAFAHQGLSANGRKPNLNAEMVAQIAERIGLPFVMEKNPQPPLQGGLSVEESVSADLLVGNSPTNSSSDKVSADLLVGNSPTNSSSGCASHNSPLNEGGGVFAPIDVLDYIYGVLHSPRYRQKFKEFLKIDFPRVPYPEDAEMFWQLAALGGKLRQIHLLESPALSNFITSYPVDGDNRVTRRITQKDWEIIDREQKVGRVWINDRQYFEGIPETAWEFYIGGYQPAQKWLKDRGPQKGNPGRILDYADIMHYQKIIVALAETDKIMQEIDALGYFG